LSRLLASIVLLLALPALPPLPPLPAAAKAGSANGHLLAGPRAGADRQAVARALAGHGIERVPRPPEASYARDVGAALQRALVRLFTRGRVPRPSRAVLIGVVALVAAAALLLLLLKGVLPAWRRRRIGGAGDEAPGEAPAGLPAALPELDAARWRAELDRCLADGQVAEGLAAAWWWLARSVAGPRVEPNWTGRDLLAHTRRPDLRELVRALDVLLYGPQRPAIDDLRRLVGRMEERLA
jgi:hypothetical protein